MYFLKEPAIRKTFCYHLLRLKYPFGSDRPFACCVRCDYKAEVRT